MSDHNNSYGKTPPISPGVRRNGGVGRRLEVKVVLLDDKVNGFQVVYRAPAQELFNAVVNKLKLLEMDYFDLEYFDKDGQQAWLDHEKSIPKQVRTLHPIDSFRVLPLWHFGKLSSSVSKEEWWDFFVCHPMVAWLLVGDAIERNSLWR